MQLSSVTDKLVQNAQRAQIEQITAITKVLGLKVGSQFLADVQKVTQATPEERAQLVKTIEANLAQLNKSSAAPAIKALITQLETQKTLAETPGVKLVTLALINSGATNVQVTAATPLLTYTNQPIHIGQTLLMRLSEGHGLQLLQPLTKAEAAAFNALLQAGNSHTSPAPANTQLLRAATADVVGETLRRLLPQKDKGQDLLASLPKITQFIQQLPLAERKEWLSSQVQQSLKTLSNHLRLSDQLSNPKLLEMALKNNGQTFENKLAQLAGQKNSALAATSNPASSPAHKNSVASAAFNAINGTTTALLKAGNQSGTTNTQIATHQVSVERIASQDLKGALLGLLHQLGTELEATKPPLAGSLITGELNKNLLAIALPQFLGVLANRQQGELSQKQLRTQLVMLMHQYTLGSLAKIQLQQVHRLNHQLGQADQPQPTQSWQFEIPVRHGQDLHPIQIQMEQHWVDDKEEAEQSNQRIRQWSVMIGFDLPLTGRFYAQLTVLGDNLAAKFWAENENTLLEAKNGIDGLKMLLEGEGIRVTQLQCLPGLPPKPKMSVSYSLVDIKT